MPIPDPTPIFRFVLVDNLPTILKRGGIHSPNTWPNDGLPYRMCHNLQVQNKRAVASVSAGPGGVILDYVPFYFGYLSVMMLNLKTGRVAGYSDGQEPLIYLVSTAQIVVSSGAGFAFSDGHGLATMTDWYGDLNDLGQVDWDMVYQRYWTDRPDDNDRQRRKQAEFLVHEFASWSLVQEIGVIDDARRVQVEGILAGFPPGLRKPVAVRRNWYYW